MTVSIVISEDGVDPVSYVESYFPDYNADEISIMIGYILLYNNFHIGKLGKLMGLKKIEIEEKMGRLLQSDLLIGRFNNKSFELQSLQKSIKLQESYLTLDERLILSFIKVNLKVTLEEFTSIFSITKQNLIILLTTFLTKGFISVKSRKNEEFEFNVHYTMNPKAVSELTDIEKEVIGYALISENITIPDLANYLDLTEHKVQGILLNALLSNQISCDFVLKKSLFGTPELEIIVKRVITQFPERTADEFSELEKIISGFISLKTPVGIEEVMDLTQINQLDLIKVISKLSMTNQVVVRIDKNQFIHIKKRPSITKVIAVEDITTSFNVNLLMLMGIISSNSSVSLSNASRQMREEKSNVIKGIILLYLSGLITGSFVNKNTFEVKATKVIENEGELTINYGDRILLGALIANKTLDWGSIGELLDLDRMESRERAYEFVSKNIGKSIVDKARLTLVDVPKLPPLNEVEDLNNIDQYLLGYTIARNKPTYKEISSLFKIDKITILKKLYYLSGSGLLNLVAEKNDIQVKKIQLSDPSTPLSELPTKYQELIRVIESRVNNTLSLKNIMNILKIPNEELLLQLSWLVVMGYYQFTLNKKDVIVSRNLFKVKEKGRCLSCKAVMNDYKKTCVTCMTDPPKCSVCKGAVGTVDKLVSCPFCQHYSHTSHLKEWLKIRGECPICRHRLKDDQLIIIA